MYLYGLSEKADVSEIGYKGKMLAQLHLLADQTLYPDLNIVVPETLILSADFYRDQIEHLIQQHTALFNDLSTLASRQSLSHTMIHELARISPDRETVEELEEWLGSFPDSTTFVLRTSATTPNRIDAVRSGQYGSFFSLTRLQVWRHVQKCLQALWRPEAIGYRCDQGLSHRDSAVAVMVQPMIEQTAFGVAFAISPVNGRLDDSHVHIMLPAKRKADISPLFNHGWRVQWRPASGYPPSAGSLASPEPSAQVTCLTDDDPARLPLVDKDVIRMAHLARTVMQMVNTPHSVEWILSGRQVYLMQARPQTCLPDRFERTNTQNLFPEPLTPLTGECARDALNQFLNDAGEQAGLTITQYQGCDYRDGFIYGNQTVIEQLTLSEWTGQGQPKTGWPELPGHHHHSSQLLSLTADDLNDLGALPGTIAALPSQDLSQVTMSQCQQSLDKVWALTREYFCAHVNRLLAKQFFSRHLYHILVTAIDDPQERQRLYLALIAAAQTNTARTHKQIRTWVKQWQDMDPPPTALTESEPADLHASFHGSQMFKQVLWTCQAHNWCHGRDFYESGDCDTPQAMLTWWHPRSSVILDVDVQTPLRHAQQTAIKTLFEQVPPAYHFALRGLAHYTDSVAAIEQLDDLHARHIGRLLRQTLTGLGQRLRMAEPLDLFFLTRADIRSLQRWRLPPALQQRIATRKAHYQDQLRGDTHPDKTVTSVSTDAARPDDPSNHHPGQPSHYLVLSGIAASAGIVRRVVYRANDPEDLVHMPAGAVLVVRRTYPAWLPLFYRASGVIAEHGDALSHCAITARELGIPAVVGVEQALTQLTDHQRVELDGLAGTVTVIP